MPTSPEKLTAKSDLLVDLEELRTRLQEAEETLNAIRSGDVDALVVMGPHGEQIFSLRGAEQPYRLLIEKMQEGAMTISADGTIMYCNQYFSEMLQIPLEQLISSNIQSLVAPKDQPFFAALFQQGMAANSKGELHLITGSGAAVPVYISISSLAIDGVQGACLVAADLTAQKRNEEIVASEKLAQSILDQAVEAIVVCDDRGIIIRASQAAHRLGGENLILRHFDAVFPMMWDVDSEVVSNLIISSEADGNDSKILLNGQKFSIASIPGRKALKSMGVIFTRRDGRVFNLLISAGELLDAHDKSLGCVVTMTDITDRKQVEQRLVHLAQYDLLTGLPNRTLFRDRLNQAMTRAARNDHLVALMFLDLDRFKDINDNLGHYAGDVLLRSVAKRLSHCTREIDTVARLGGDEFTIILEEISNEGDVAVIAQEILDSFSNPFIIDDHEIFVTASIGISIHTVGVHNADVLLKDADTAMYHAKEEGRNNYQFHLPRMNSRSLARINMGNDLRHALDRDEFRLYYQPQVDLGTGIITGVEALVRWQHPQHGLINPSKFIDLAEDTGMIVPIGEWILDTACAQNKAWQDADIPPLRISVNHSARQFRQLNLVRRVRDALKSTRLSAQYLGLEITEGLLMDNNQTNSAVIAELKNMGVAISIDDFGTGYSSLSYLKRFPVDILKIDQSFVQNIHVDPVNAPIVTAIITLAKSLGLTVIAEGVETEDQLAFLRMQGCDSMQGYLFSQPLPAHELTQLLRERKKLAPAHKVNQSSY